MVKTSAETRKDTQAKIAKDHEMVKGIFRYYEVPGGKLDFVYRKYKNDPIEKYDMQDGMTYTVPLCVAKHLNTNGWYPVHVHTTDANGKAVIGLGTKKHRFGFQSLEFVDLSDGEKLQTVGPDMIQEVFEVQQ